MAYTTIPNSDVDPDSPLTTSLLTALRDNPTQDDTPLKAKAGATEVLLSTQTASSSANLDFSGLDSTYPVYLFRFESILPATVSVSLNIRVSTDLGVSFISTNSYEWLNYGYDTGAGNPNSQNTSDAQIKIAGGINGVSNTAESALGGELRFYSPDSTTAFKKVEGNFVYGNGSNYTEFINSAGAYTTTTNSVTDVRFLMSSGNIASGTIRMYGIRGA